MVEVKCCFKVRELTIQENKECVKDRRKWKFIVEGDVDD